MQVTLNVGMFWLADLKFQTFQWKEVAMPLCQL